MPKNLLFLAPLPPPFHGSSVVSNEILSYLRGRGNLMIDVKNIMTSTNKGIPAKIGYLFTTIVELRRTAREYEIIYFAPSVNGFGFLKDFLLYLNLPRSKRLIFHFHNKGVARNWFFSPLYKRMFTNGEAIVLSDSMIEDVKIFFKRSHPCFE